MLEDKLDLTFYAGQDLYSDGDVEEELLQAVQKPDTIEETLLTGNSWPHLYHLSNIRENILDWYNFNPEGTLLELRLWSCDRIVLQKGASRDSDRTVKAPFHGECDTQCAVR